MSDHTTYLVAGTSLLNNFGHSYIYLANHEVEWRINGNESDSPFPSPGTVHRHAIAFNLFMSLVQHLDITVIIYDIVYSDISFITRSDLTNKLEFHALNR